jgi:hypothetical protein
MLHISITHIAKQLQASQHAGDQTYTIPKRLYLHMNVILWPKLFSLSLNIMPSFAFKVFIINVL